MQKFSDKEYDEVTLVYNHFKNAATQIVTKEQYLPIEESVDENNSVSGDYIFEPNRPKILNEVKKYKIPMIALFPHTPDNKKDPNGNEALNPNNVSWKSLRCIKKKFPNISLERYDERYTSLMAKKVIIQSGVSKSKRKDKSLVDKISATIILQSYLENLKK